MPFRLRHRKNREILPVAFIAIAFLLVIGSAPSGFAQAPPQFGIFNNYFVTGDYVVGGWVEDSSKFGAFVSGYATGTISIPDCVQYAAINGITLQACQSAPPPAPVPVGADIVAAYLYWGTVEGSQTAYAGEQAYFNGYKIVGKVLGNPKAPTSWSSGGCTGSSTGSKTMRIYRADVRPYLPIDTSPSSPTFGAIIANPSVQVLLADSGSTGNTQPNALGATLVLIWRVLAPSTPLNAIVLYDGSFAPSNSNPTMTEILKGFYQPATSGTIAKLTHIVANGQPNKNETVYFGPTPPPNTQLPGPLTSLPNLYPAYTNPFPGIYGAWDNPTWSSGVVNGQNYSIGSLMAPGDSQTTFVQPTSTNSGCVNWGAVILSTTVQDSTGDGLLDIWKENQGYVNDVPDPNTGLQTAIALPGANLKPTIDKDIRDLFVQVDYLALRDPNTQAILHSHLPKKDALDAIGVALAAKKINVHFDLPAGIYSDDPYVISTGNALAFSENKMLCTDGAVLCAFPNQLDIKTGLPIAPSGPAISWKGGFEAVKDSNFQAGRQQSYHYALFGHALGSPRSYWGAIGTAFAQRGTPAPQLVSIVVSSGVATVTLKSAPSMLKPGDFNLPAICNVANPPPIPCNDGNGDRITVSGSLLAPIVPAVGAMPPHLGTPPLNGTYQFSNVCPANAGCGPDANGDGLVTTIFSINTPNVPDGTYSYSNEPQLGISYLGPTGTSGHGDFGGGGDLAVTLGLWRADNASGCQVDPSVPAAVYCDDQVGTLKGQTGTFMHELGHTLTLTHGGSYYPSTFTAADGSVTNYPSLPTYEMNCKSNYISVMNYLFQVRGFVDGNIGDTGGTPPSQPFKFDYSRQWLPPLRETTCLVGAPKCLSNAPTYYNQFGNSVDPLSEFVGVGTDPSSQPAEHLTRWYSFPNSADNALADQAVGFHCDGSPALPADPMEVRVDGTVGTAAYPHGLDWNNDLTLDNVTTVAAAGNGIDLNHNGIIGDPAFSGFNDYDSADFQQMNARASGFGFSEGGGLIPGGGGGLIPGGGGGVDTAGGGLIPGGGGGLIPGGGGGLIPGGGGGLIPGGGGGLIPGGGGGLDQDTQTANSTVDVPANLSCMNPVTFNGTTYPACTGSSPLFTEKSKGVPLTWASPDFGQIRSYTIWRAMGSFPTVAQVTANIGKFSKLPSPATGMPPTLTGSPPLTQFVDTTVKSSTTYTYFVTDSNFFKANSSFSTPIVVLVKF